ncbi:MAG: 2-dehydropantoate 2-reductase [Sedimentisphaerales bacterium]|nr:2-dehydropantoate 2-reductase [Sedimentisphaerales bacterium]
MKIMIYGGGAVGLGLASCLLKSRQDVHIVARQDTVSALSKGGLLRTGIFGRYYAEAKEFSACESAGEIKNQTFDFILVCTKSFDSAGAAEDLSRHKGIFGDNTKIVLCQNGWGNAEKFTAHFPEESVYSARVITGFTRHKPNEVEITVHADAIHIGSLFGCENGCVEPLAGAIAEGGIPCATVSDIEKDLWAKMLYNCALNPLGAILDVPYGALAENGWSRDLMNRIVEEVFAVMKAAGFSTHRGSAEGFLKVFYDKLVPDTAGHKSSTLQDIEAGKKTEIDALTGEVIAMAEKNKVVVPYNRAIYGIIKFLELSLVGGGG